MSPSPLEPSTVHITLQYIAPPSQLDQPLPPHLLSKPLLQRHHFLQIPPDDPSQYLCWPSDASTKAVDILESLPRLDDVPQTYPVQYTSDTEQTYAHVALTPPGGDAARLVFQWDEPEGWKFHDIRLMPFPQGSKASLSEVPASSQSSRIVPHAAAAVAEYNQYGQDDQNDSNDDDDYWNAYGADDSDDPSTHNALSASKDTASDGEDAYWARYASVQGTADSTIPSPPIQKRRLDSYPSQPSEFEPSYTLPLPPLRSDFHNPQDGIIQFPTSLITQNFPTGSRRSDPASPKDLARRLAELSPRHSPVVVSHFAVTNVAELGLSPPFDASDSSDAGTSSTDALGLITDSESPHAVPQLVGDVEAEDEGEEALTQSIKGLYAMWKLSRARNRASSERDDRMAFMRAVEGALS